MTHHYCCSWCEKEFSSTPDTGDDATATCPVCGMAAYPRHDNDHVAGDSRRKHARSPERDIVE